MFLELCYCPMQMILIIFFYLVLDYLKLFNKYMLLCLYVLNFILNFIFTIAINVCVMRNAFFYRLKNSEFEIYQIALHFCALTENILFW